MQLSAHSNASACKHLFQPLGKNIVYLDICIEKMKCWEWQKEGTSDKHMPGSRRNNWGTTPSNQLGKLACGTQFMKLVDQKYEQVGDRSACTWDVYSFRDNTLPQRGIHIAALPRALYLCARQSATHYCKAGVVNVLQLTSFKSSLVGQAHASTPLWSWCH